MSIRTIDDARIACLHDTLYFTMALFRLEHRRDFIVSEHHRLICDALNDVARGRCRKLIINMPPRYGKTELAVTDTKGRSFCLSVVKDGGTEAKIWVLSRENGGKSTSKNKFY